MPLDARFYEARSAATVAELAARSGATLRDDAHADRSIKGISSLTDALPGDLAFLTSAKFGSAAAQTRAGACFVDRTHADLIPTETAALICDDPQRAFAAAASDLVRPWPAWQGEGTAPARDPSAKLGERVTVGPYAVIGPHAQIGDGTVIGAHSVIGRGVAIGRDCIIGEHATVAFSLLGDRVAVKAGARIGGTGFGFASDAGGHLRMPQIGRAILQDDVDVGANSTVDRGAIGDTVIGEGTKIDNLVQIGHNCRIGRHCVLVSQVGLSGSVTLEDFVVLGGKVGVADHIRIGAGAQVAAKSGVTNDIPAGAVYAGFPARPVGEWRRSHAVVSRLVRKSRRRSKP